MKITELSVYAICVVAVIGFWKIPDREKLVAMPFLNDQAARIESSAESKRVQKDIQLSIEYTNDSDFRKSLSSNLEATVLRVVSRGKTVSVDIAEFSHSKFGNLHSLDLDNVMIQGSSSDVKWFGQIKRLVISGKNCSDVGTNFFPLLARLAHLELVGTSITKIGLGKIQTIPGLESIKISNQRSPIISADFIKKHRSLASIGLYDSYVSDDLAKAVSSARSLQSYSIYHSGRRLNNIQKFTRNEMLPHSVDNIVTNQSFFNLSNNNTITNLSVVGYNIDDVGVSALSNRHSLKGLVLSDVNITGSSLLVISRLPGLETLDISGNDLSNIIKTNEAAAPKLVFQKLFMIDISRCTVSDDTVGLICNAKSVEHLDVSQASITAKSMELFIKAFPKLKTIRMYKTFSSDDADRLIDTYGNRIEFHR